MQRNIITKAAHAAVAVTRGIMRICTREELKGVIGHELSHVLNRDILISTVAATLAGVVMMIGTMARWGAMFAVLLKLTPVFIFALPGVIALVLNPHIAAGDTRAMGPVADVYSLGHSEVLTGKQDSL